MIKSNKLRQMEMNRLKNKVRVRNPTTRLLKRTTKRILVKKSNRSQTRLKIKRTLLRAKMIRIPKKINGKPQY